MRSFPDMARPRMVALLAVVLTVPACTGTGTGASAPVAGLVPSVTLPSPVSVPGKLGSVTEAPPGFPGPRTTGVPADARLVVEEGDMVITKDRFVLRDVELRGCLSVRADDVVVERVRIRCDGSGSSPFPLRMSDEHERLRVVDSEIDGMGKARVAVYGSDYDLLRVDVHDAADGLRMGSRTSLRESWVHDLARSTGTHNDVIQTLGGNGILVEGNSLVAYRRSTDDPMNGVIQTGRLHEPLRDMTVRDNYMNGGSFTVRGGGKRDAGLISDYVFRGNVVGFGCGFGPLSDVELGRMWDSSNRWVDGEPITGDPQIDRYRCTKRERSRVVDR